MSKIKLTRRTLIRGLVRAGTMAGAGILGACTAPRMPAMPGMNHGGAAAPDAGHGAMDTPYLNSGRPMNTSFKPDLDIALTAKPDTAQILPGQATQVWRFEANVLAGDARQVGTPGPGYLGPILRVQRGQKIRIRYTNGLPAGAASNIHWHGLRPPNEMDGHPQHVVAPGQSFNYEFEITDPAMTAWFHPHPHGDTGRQVYMGLAGLFIVSDPAENALGLPSGEFDVPLVIQDRSFDANNQLIYFGRGMMSGRMEQMMGFYGERALVNGRPDFTLEVAARAYRLRILNGSNARIYKLTMSNNAPLLVIGSDNGLLEKPVTRSYVMLAPGERVELWMNFSGRAIGDTVKLITKHFEGAENVPVPDSMRSRMGGGMMMHGGAAEQGAEMELMTFRVAAPGAGAPQPLPSTLRALPLPPESVVAKKTFEVGHRAMTWQFNGRSWDETVTQDERVRQGSTEEWTFINKLNPGEMMDPMGMAHPIHLHGVHYKIIERKQLVPELNTLGYNDVKDGFLDEGMKDTFLLMPGEQVKFRVTFAQEKGRYVYHCHNLEHEDQGLMRNYEVV